MRPHVLTCFVCGWVNVLPQEKDPDPEGALLAATPDPLGAAAKLVAQLKANAPHVLDAQLVACEVYLRKGRLLLALSAAQRAAGIAGAAHPDVHRAVVRLAQKGGGCGGGDGGRVCVGMLCVDGDMMAAAGYMHLHWGCFHASPYSTGTHTGRACAKAMHLVQRLAQS